MAQITIKGNVGKDPELKTVNTSRGSVPLVEFSLAYTPRERKGEDWVDGETSWFRVIQWGTKAENLINTISKGDTVIVLGTLKQSSYKAKDGTTKSALEINASDIGIVPKVSKKAEEVPTW